MRSSVKKNYVVSATASQVNETHITVVYQGCLNDASVSGMNVTFTNATGSSWTDTTYANTKPSVGTE